MKFTTRTLARTVAIAAVVCCCFSLDLDLPTIDIPTVDHPPLSTVTLAMDMETPAAVAAFNACMELPDGTAEATGAALLLSAMQFTMPMEMSTETMYNDPVTGKPIAFNATLGGSCGPNCWKRLAMATHKFYPESFQTSIGVAKCLAERGVEYAPSANIVTVAPYGMEVLYGLEFTRWSNAIGPMASPDLVNYAVPFMEDVAPGPDPRTNVIVTPDGAVIVDICIDNTRMMACAVYAAAIPCAMVPEAGCTGADVCNAESESRMRFIIRPSPTVPLIPNAIDAMLEEMLGGGGDEETKRSLNAARSLRTNAPKKKTAKKVAAARTPTPAKTVTVNGVSFTLPEDFKTKMQHAPESVMARLPGAQCSSMIVCLPDGEVISKRNTDWGVGAELIDMLRGAVTDVNITRPTGLPAPMNAVFQKNAFYKTSIIPIADGVNGAIGMAAGNKYATGVHTLQSLGRLPTEVVLALAEADLHETWNSPIPHPMPNALAMLHIMEHSTSYDNALEMMIGKLDVMPHMIEINSDTKGAIYVGNPFVEPGTHFREVDCSSDTNWLQFATNFVDFEHTFTSSDGEILRHFYMMSEQSPDVRAALYSTKESAYARMTEILDRPHILGVWTDFTITPDIATRQLNTMVRFPHYENDEIQPSEMPLLNCIKTGFDMESQSCQCYGAIMQGYGTCEELAAAGYCLLCDDCGVCPEAK